MAKLLGITGKWRNAGAAAEAPFVRFEGVRDVAEMKAKLSAYNALFDFPQAAVFVRGCFENTATGDLAFIRDSWHRVFNLGRTIIELEIDAERGMYRQYKPREDGPAEAFDIELRSLG